MSKKHKLPFKEATGERNLSGSYLISFRLTNLSEKDDLIISDIIEGIARSFEDSEVLSKVSHVDVEKTDKSGIPLSQKTLKIGSSAQLNQKVLVTVPLKEDNGHYITSSKLSSQIAPEIEIALAENSQATINDIKGNYAELIDLDATAEAIMTDEYGEEQIVSIDIDSVLVPLEFLDNIGD